MRRFDKIWFAGLALLFVFGCAGSYSIREQNIISKIPADQRDYKGGIICEPTDEDITKAISLGIESKDTDALEYAYLIKLPGDFFEDDTIYLKVATPLYFVGKHARQQSREYRLVDQKYIEYARRLKAARISLTQQYMSQATLRQYAFQRHLILLRDGVRVEPLKEIVAYGGQSPFSEGLPINAKATVARATQMASQYSRAYMANINDAQKAQLIRTYRTMGLSDDQIGIYTGLTADEIRGFSAGGEQVQDGKNPDKKVDGQGTRIAISEYDGVFSIEELTKPGKYEIIFRTPPSASLISRGDKEVRFPITFDKFK